MAPRSQNKQKEKPTPPKKKVDKPGPSSVHEIRRQRVTARKSTHSGRVKDAREQLDRVKDHVQVGQMKAKNIVKKANQDPQPSTSGATTSESKKSAALKPSHAATATARKSIPTSCRKQVELLLALNTSSDASQIPTVGQRSTDSSPVSVSPRRQMKQQDGKHVTPEKAARKINLCQTPTNEELLSCPKVSPKEAEEIQTSKFPLVTVGPLPKEYIHLVPSSNKSTSPPKNMKSLKDSPKEDKPVKDTPRKDKTPKDSPRKDKTPKDSPSKDKTPNDSPRKDNTPKDSPTKDKISKDSPRKDNTEVEKSDRHLECNSTKEETAQRNIFEVLQETVPKNDLNNAQDEKKESNSLSSVAQASTDAQKSSVETLADIHVGKSEDVKPKPRSALALNERSLELILEHVIFAKPNIASKARRNEAEKPDGNAGLQDTTITSSSSGVSEEDKANSSGLIEEDKASSGNEITPRDIPVVGQSESVDNCLSVPSINPTDEEAVVAAAVKEVTIEFPDSPQDTSSSVELESSRRRDPAEDQDSGDICDSIDEAKDDATDVVEVTAISIPIADKDNMIASGKSIFTEVERNVLPVSQGNTSVEDNNSMSNPEFEEVLDLEQFIHPEERCVSDTAAICSGEDVIKVQESFYPESNSSSVIEELPPSLDVTPVSGSDDERLDENDNSSLQNPKPLQTPEKGLRIPLQNLEKSPAIEKIKPDFDEVQGLLFMSFPSRDAMRAHSNVEACARKELGVKHVDFLKDISQYHALDLQHSSQEQLKQKKGLGNEEYRSMRGIHKRIRKYEHMLKAELRKIKSHNTLHPDLKKGGVSLDEGLVVSLNLKELGIDLNPPPPVQQLSPNSVPGYVSPKGKTNDITKIKGWRRKFGMLVNEDDDELYAPRQLFSEHNESDDKTPDYGLKHLSEKIKKKKKKSLSDKIEALKKSGVEIQVQTGSSQSKTSGTSPTNLQKNLGKPVGVMENEALRNFEKTVTTSKSAFVSNTLDAYLEQQEKTGSRQTESLTNPFSHPLLQSKNASVTFKIPTKPASAPKIKTLQSVLAKKGIMLPAFNSSVSNMSSMNKQQKSQEAVKSKLKNKTKSKPSRVKQSNKQISGPENKASQEQKENDKAVYASHEQETSPTSICYKGNILVKNTADKSHKLLSDGTRFKIIDSRLVQHVAPKKKKVPTATLR